MTTLMTTYAPLPITFSQGKGAWLWDSEGKQYLDALGGIAVCALGHAHPAITQAITEQASKLLHTSNVYHIAQQQELADKLCALSGMAQAFFANSGAEANEAALKLCRLYGHHQGISDPAIIVMEKAFHGRTLATLSASGSRKVHAGFEPLVQGFIRAPFNDLSALQTIAQKRHDVVAVMLEPIQGEGGIHVPDKDYLQQVRALCDEHNWLLVLDEIQTGIGRTGQFYAYQHHGILPDIVTTAKALGNGIPIGACLSQGKAKDLFQPGNHGSTFGGNPFACHVASAVLNTLEQQGLIEQAALRGNQLFNGLQQALQHHPHVVAIRGQGLMLGIELDTPCRELLKIGLRHGLLFGMAQDKVIRLLPPYIISSQEVDLIIERLVASLNDFFQN